MPYSDNDTMINDLLSSMNLSIDSPKDKININGQLARKALDFKFNEDEVEKLRVRNEDAKRLLPDKGTKDSSDSSGGNEFNLSADDVSGIISSMMS